MGVCYLAEESVDATEKYAEQARMDAEEKYLIAAGKLGMQDGGSPADDNSGIRRRLGAAPAERSETNCRFFSNTPVVSMPCGMDQAEIENKTSLLFTTAQQNLTGERAAFRSVCSLAERGCSLDLRACCVVLCFARAV